MRQLTIPRGNCKRSSQNVPIFSFLWQGSCTYGQAVDDWGVHYNDGKLDQFFPLQIWSPPCLALQLIALEIPNLEDHSKYKYNPAFKSILGYLFHEDWCDWKKEVNSIFLVANFGLMLKGKPKIPAFKGKCGLLFFILGTPNIRGGVLKFETESQILRLFSWGRCWPAELSSSLTWHEALTRHRKRRWGPELINHWQQWSVHSCSNK